MPQVSHIKKLGISYNSPAPKENTVCAKFELKNLRPFEEMYPFKKARLNDCDGDLSGRWYIEFYAWDVQKKKLVRKRFYGVNNIASGQERRIYANRIIQQLNTLLKEGYHFDVNKVPPPGALTIPSCEIRLCSPAISGIPQGKQFNTPSLKLRCTKQFSNSILLHS